MQDAEYLEKLEKSLKNCKNTLDFSENGAYNRAIRLREATETIQAGGRALYLENSIFYIL